MKVRPFVWVAAPAAALAITLALNAPSWVIALVGALTVTAVGTETVRWRQERQ